jgi:hypothetical protein
MSDAVVYAFLGGIATAWIVMLWLALREPKRGGPRKNQHDQTRNP